MTADFLVKLVSYPMQVLAVLTALAMLARLPVRNWWAWTVTGLGLVAFGLGCWVVVPCGTDIEVFWGAGRDTLAGADPYQNLKCVNPPTAFAFYALFGWMTFEQCLAVWTAVNAVAVCFLVVLTQQALAASDADRAWLLPAPLLGVLTAATVLSVSCRYGLDVGQMSIFTALVLLLAVFGWTRGRPVLAGIGLALGTFKIATTLPFLLLFHRRRDRAVWVALPTACLGLYLLANPAGEMFTRLGECLGNIGTLSHTMNRYSAGGINADMIAIDRGLFFAGVTDPTTVKLLNWSILLTLGAWVAWRVMGRNALAPAPAVCLIAFYACLFLYHRLYDTVLLVLPLVYAAGRARTELGWARWLYAASAAAILALFFLRLETVKELAIAATQGPQPPHPLLQAVLIPSALWLVLIAMFSFAAAERCRTKPRNTMLAKYEPFEGAADLRPGHRWRESEEPACV